MSHLDEESIKKLTKLCRIECSADQRAALLKDLEKILAYFDQIEEIDTEGVEPCNHVLADVFNVMREDEVGETLPRELLLSNAPAHREGYFTVPPVIDKRRDKEGEV